MLAKISLLFISTFASFFFLEFSIRSLKLAPEMSRIEFGRFQVSKNPLIGIEPIPYSTSNMNSELYEDHLRMKEPFNSLGFRDVEPHLKKEDTLQIMFLGDSVTMGERISDLNNAYVRLVGEILSNENIKAQTINFGVSGYNTVQEVETLRTKGISFKPDIVVLQYCYNDTEGSSDGQRTLSMIKQLSSTSMSFERSLLSRFPNSALARLIIATLPSQNVSHDNYYHELLQPDIKKALRKLITLSEENNFKVIMFVFPTQNMIEGNEQNRDRDFKNFLGDLPIERHFLKEALEACSKEIDGNKIKLFTDYYHPNEIGHKCAAHYISKEIAQIVKSDSTYNKYLKNSGSSF